MKRIAQLLMVLAGLIHLLPLSGAFGAARLQALHAAELGDPNLLISAGSFIAIALWVGNYNDALQRIVIADIVAIACLIAAWLVFGLAGRHRASSER